MGFFSDKCPQCGGKVRRGASFCPHCGEPAPRSSLICPACSKEIRAGGKFCPKCGAPVESTSEEPMPVDELNRWRPLPDEFARRIEAADLRGALSRGIVVEPGTKALLFQGGALAGVVTQGTYDLNRPLEGVELAAPATAILIREGDVALPLVCRDLRTREDVPAEAAVEVVVRLADARALYANLMHGRDRLSTGGLADLVESESANVVQARVRAVSVDQLEGNLDLKATLEADLRQEVAPSLARNGIELVGLRLVGFAAEGFDEIREARAKTFLAGQKIDETERRAALNRRLRETLTRDRMDKFTSERDFREFIRQTEHELGMKEVIREAEMDDLVRTFREKREDAETARKHLLEKLELEQRLEVLGRQHAVDDAELRHRLEGRRRELEAQQASEWQQVQQRLAIGKAVRGDALEAERDDLQFKREKFQLGKEAREWKDDRDHQRESLRIGREQEERDREARRRIDEADREAARELERMRAMSEAEQARLAADLKKTEVLGGMSEEQILALMAKDSPHVAQAIAERAKARAQAGASAEVKALYERILAGKEAEADRLERVMERALGNVERVAGGAAAREREHTGEIKDVTADAMDRMADVAGAKAGAPGGAAAGAPEMNVLCPNCHQQSPAGQKFCDNCGHRFFE